MAKIRNFDSLGTIFPHFCPDNREIWHGERTTGQILRLSGRKCGNTALKTARNLYLRGDSFAIFLRNSQCLYASIGSLQVCTLVTFKGQTPSYKHFPAVGEFSHKFSIAPIGETTDRIKKVRRVQKRDGPALSSCQVWW